MKGRTRRNYGLLVGLVLVALVMPCSPLALTTFGKSPQNYNNNQKEEKQQPGVQARECASDSECAGIKDSSCLESIFTDDKKLRCLCGDYNVPRNGLCESKYKRVKVLCNSNDECISGSHCVMSNDTSAPGWRCHCMQDYAVDVDMQCNGSPITFGFSALSLIASLLLAGSV